LARLWDEKQGIFANRRTDTGEFSTRLSPTNFYPLLAGAATPQQARRMMDEHLLNPPSSGATGFCLPSRATTRLTPEQHYWRGRIWAPMNFLVYLGLKRANLDREAAMLAQKSAALFLQEWRAHGHVHENYHADSGWGCGYEYSDRFYHWGALLGLMALLETA
jgi:neutral trehalase